MAEAKEPTEIEILSQRITELEGVEVLVKKLEKQNAALLQDNSELLERTRMLERSNEPEGLWEKYRVVHRGTKEMVAKPFVLVPEKDPHALVAIETYAEVCKADNPILSAELVEWTAKLAHDAVSD